MSIRTVVVGGGVAGLGVAVELSRRGHPVTVLEAAAQPGGYAAQWPCMATDRCQRCGVCLVHDTLAAVRGDPAITLRTGQQVTAVERNAGGYTVRARPTPVATPVERGSSGDGEAAADARAAADTDAETALEADAVVLATGFEPFDPTGSRPIGHEGLAAAVTTAELDRALQRGALDALGFGGGSRKRIAFLQCVGSRDPEAGRPYCSQICCTVALNAARRLLHVRPDWEVTVFYIDLQVHGKEARQRFDALPAGVRLIQGVPAELRPPTGGQPGEETAGDTNGSLAVAYQAPDGAMVLEDFDGAVMTVGMVPRAGSAELGAALGLEPTLGGFLPDPGAGRGGDDPDRPSSPTGLYTVGACRGPANIEASLLQARDVATRLLRDHGDAGAPDAAGADDPWAFRPPPRRLGLAAPAADVPEAASVPQTSRPVRREVAVVGAGPEADTVTRALEDQGLPVRTVVPTRCLSLTGSLGDFTVMVRGDSGREPLSVGAVVLATGLSLQMPPAADGLGARPLDEDLPPAPFADGLALWLDAGGFPWRAQAHRALTVARERAEAGETVTLLTDHVPLAGLEAQATYDRARCAGARVLRSGGVPPAPAATPVAPPDADPLGRDADPDPKRPDESPDGAKPPDAPKGGQWLAVRDALAPEIPARLRVSHLLAAQHPVTPAPEAGALGIRTDAEGFAQHGAVRLAPLRTERAGVYAFGSARGEALAPAVEAEATALGAELRSLLGGGTLIWPDAAVTVLESRCIKCLSCVRTCPHGALQMPHQDRAPEVRALACEACGQCVAVCPAHAIRDRDAPPAAPASRISSGTERMRPAPALDPVPPLTVLACRNSGGPALREAEASGLIQRSGYDVVELPCGGAVHELSVLGTLLAGGQRVALLTCHPGSCAHLEGEHRCALRVGRIHDTLAGFGLPADTVVQIPVSPAEPARLARRLRDLRDPLTQGGAS